MDSNIIAKVEEIEEISSEVYSLWLHIPDDFNTISFVYITAKAEGNTFAKPSCIEISAKGPGNILSNAIGVITIFPTIPNIKHKNTNGPADTFCDIWFSSIFNWFIYCFRSHQTF